MMYTNPVLATRLIQSVLVSVCMLLLTGEGCTHAAGRYEVVLHHVACVGRLTTTATTHQYHRLVPPRRQHTAVRRLSNGIDVRRHVLWTAAAEHLNHLPHCNGKHRIVMLQNIKFSPNLDIGFENPV